MKRKIRMGMVGGGQGSFIGAVHRIAANLDGQIELVCGCFSSRPENSLATGQSLFLPDNRIYASYQEMIEKEAALPEGERMDFVSIVTPNHVHFGPAMMALEHGFHVVLDKPMTYTLDEAKQLRDKVKETGKLFMLTHTYTAYPMVKEARERVRRGDLGKIRRIYVEYPQGWLYNDCADVNKQAAWRVDPGRSGKAGCMGDIGTHAFNLAEYITGLKAVELCGELNTFVPDRLLDDDGAALIRYEGGAKGVLTASQIAVGVENGLNIRVYGEKGGLEWRQEEPNTMVMRWPDRPADGVFGDAFRHLAAYDKPAVVMVHAAVIEFQQCAAAFNRQAAQIVIRANHQTVSDGIGLGDQVVGDARLIASSVIGQHFPAHAAFGHGAAL